MENEITENIIKLEIERDLIIEKIREEKKKLIDELSKKENTPIDVGGHRFGCVWDGINFSKCKCGSYKFYWELSYMAGWSNKRYVNRTKKHYVNHYFISYRRIEKYMDENDIDI